MMPSPCAFPFVHTQSKQSASREKKMKRALKKKNKVTRDILLIINTTSMSEGKEE